jgi:hypothetical protein
MVMIDEQCATTYIERQVALRLRPRGWEVDDQSPGTLALGDKWWI